MIRSQVQSAFPVQSLSTQHFRWMHEETWEPDDIRFFAQNLVGNGTNIFIPFFHSPSEKRRKFPKKLGRWVLHFGRLPQDSTRCGSAELWQIPGAFNSMQLHVNMDKTAISMSEFGPLEFLVTAMIIGGKSDVLRIVPAGSEVEERLDQMLNDAGRTVLSMIPVASPRALFMCEDKTDDLVRMRCFHIDGREWLKAEVPYLIAVKGALQYLEQRMAPKPSLDRPRSQKGLRSIFSGRTRRRMKATGKNPKK